MPRKPRAFAVGGTCHAHRRFGGVERRGLKVKDLAVVIGRGAGSTSRLYAQAAAERRTGPAVRALIERVTKMLRKRRRDHPDNNE